MSRFCPVWIAVLVLLTVGLVSQAQPGGGPETPRGYLGILVGPAEEGSAGVLVREVTADSPAAKAGLKSGDRVVKLGDEDVADVEKFLRSVAAKKPGDRLVFGVLRDGKEQRLTVTLGERADRERPTFPELPGLRRPAFLGVQTQALTAELKERLNVPTDAGAVITEVVPNSPAARAGLKRDDVITAVDERPVKTPADLRDAVQKAGPGKEMTLQVVRGKEKLAVKATLREGAFGYFLTPGEDRFPTVDVESMFDQGRRIRELERRVEELEKRLRTLEKK
jgi:S1-C subfamily serine protease